MDNTPYREERPYAEKADVEELRRKVRWLRVGPISVLVCLVLCGVVYFVLDGRLSRHEVEQHGRNSSPMDLEECRDRHDYAMGQQRAAAACSRMCERYLEYGHKMSDSIRRLRLEECRQCLFLTWSAMPYEIAHPRIEGGDQ